MHIYIPFDLKVSVYTVEMHCWLCVKDCLKDKDASSCEGYDYGQSFYLSVWYHLLFLRLVLLWFMWVCLMDCPTPAELKVRLQIQHQSGEGQNKAMWINFLLTSKSGGSSLQADASQQHEHVASPDSIHAASAFWQQGVCAFCCRHFFDLS